MDVVTAATTEWKAFTCIPARIIQHCVRMHQAGHGNGDLLCLKWNLFTCSLKTTALRKQQAVGNWHLRGTFMQQDACQSQLRSSGEEPELERKFVCKSVNHHWAGGH